MPLIIVTGTPCSGKTYRARQILQEFGSRCKADESETKRSVIYIPSHHASLDPPTDGSDESYQPPEQSENPRDQIYDLARLEKTARAEEFSAIKRLIDKNVLVIADTPNYIKGFRYQLFCEAKAAGTRSVVVHTAAGEDECRAWNNTRLNAWNWHVDAITEQNGTLASDPGPKIGKDVLGELEPESHTAVYGDRAVFNGSRSRSSSMGGDDLSSEGEVNPTRRKKDIDETMTLKSLYIADKNTSTYTPISTSGPQPNDPSETIPPEYNHNTSPALVSTPYDLPSTTPPFPRASLPYSPKTFTSLLMRYEPPSPFTRWDTPLFTIPSSDPHPPYAEIWTALFPPPTKQTGKKALAQQRAAAHNNTPSTAPSAPLPPATAPAPPTANEAPEVPQVKPHAATVLPTASTPDALQILESTTGEVAKLVLAAARAAGAAGGDGGDVTVTLAIPTPLELELSIPEGVSISQPALQRLRRKYTQIQKGGIAHGQGYAQGRKNVAEGFVRFLELEWEGS